MAMDDVDSVVLADPQEPEELVEDVLEDDLPGDTPGEGEDEVVVVIEGVTPPPEEEEDRQAAPWLRELRKSHQETKRQLRERDAEIARLKASGNQPDAPKPVGDKPTLAKCDYDETKFEQELSDWHTRKRTQEEAERKKADAQRTADEAWKATVTAYEKRKAALKVSGYEDAEATAFAALNATQRGLLLKVADASEVMVYALGKNEAKLKEIAAVVDPVDFVKAVVKLESKLSVSPRKAAPLPESTVRGSAPASGVDSTLERLRSEADRTGDRTKVAAYMNKMKAAKTRP